MRLLRIFQVGLSVFLRWHVALCALILMAVGTNAVAQTRPDPAAKPKTTSTSIGASEFSTYKLGVGDVISVQVIGEDDLKREKIRLSDAGTLSFPYLGEIRVRGMTVGALEEFITKGLTGRYLLNPQVIVTIQEYRNYFIAGEVGKPGGYPYVPGITVRKAISLAGGFKERASREKINIIREADAKGLSERVSLEALLQPGDIITVEESFF